MTVWNKFIDHVLGDVAEDQMSWSPTRPPLSSPFPSFPNAGSIFPPALSATGCERRYLFPFPPPFLPHPPSFFFSPPDISIFDYMVSHLFPPLFSFSLLLSLERKFHGKYNDPLAKFPTGTPLSASPPPLSSPSPPSFLPPRGGFSINSGRNHRRGRLGRV